MKHILFVITLVIAAAGAQAQVALKTNLLYDATTTPNLGAEVRIGSRSTVTFVYGLNPWKFSSETHGQRKAEHWLLMPEYRWWTCSPFNGHFFGVHAFGGQMNVANVSLPIPGGFFGGDNLASEAKHHRYQGEFAGVGLTYGYQWTLARHWNLEAEIGVGYGHVWYDKYSCEECVGKVGSGGTNYAGVTKLGLSIMYIF